MMTEEAKRIGIAMEKPDGENCPHCNSPDYSCGTRQSVKSYHGKAYFRSSMCMTRGEAIVLDRLRELREAEISEANDQCDRTTEGGC
jgi:hypothetical protein